MMQPRDWISALVGIIIGSFGLLPLLSKMGKGSGWFAMSWLPAALFAYIALVVGFYLMVNSFIEITNSNIVGWISFACAAIITLTGLLQVLGKAGKITGFLAMGWIPDTLYYVIFLVLGLFLIIASVAMEL